jgi:hypothetical protein
MNIDFYQKAAKKSTNSLTKVEKNSLYLNGERDYFPFIQSGSSASRRKSCLINTTKT